MALLRIRDPKTHQVTKIVKKDVMSRHTYFKDSDEEDAEDDEYWKRVLALDRGGESASKKAKMATVKAADSKQAGVAGLTWELPEVADTVRERYVDKSGYDGALRDDDGFAADAGAEAATTFALSAAATAAGAVPSGLFDSADEDTDAGEGADADAGEEDGSNGDDADVDVYESGNGGRDGDDTDEEDAAAPHDRIVAHLSSAAAVLRDKANDDFASDGEGDGLSHREVLVAAKETMANEKSALAAAAKASANVEDGNHDGDAAAEPARNGVLRMLALLESMGSGSVGEGNIGSFGDLSRAAADPREGSDGEAEGATAAIKAKEEDEEQLGVGTERERQLSMLRSMGIDARVSVDTDAALIAPALAPPGAFSPSDDEEMKDVDSDEEVVQHLDQRMMPSTGRERKKVIGGVSVTAKRKNRYAAAATNKKGGSNADEDGSDSSDGDDEDSDSSSGDNDGSESDASADGGSAADSSDDTEENETVASVNAFKAADANERRDCDSYDEEECTEAFVDKSTDDASAQMPKPTQRVHRVNPKVQLKTDRNDAKAAWQMLKSGGASKRQVVGAKARYLAAAAAYALAHATEDEHHDISDGTDSNSDDDDSDSSEDGLSTFADVSASAALPPGSSDGGSSDSENDELDGDYAFAAAAEGTADEEVDTSALATSVPSGLFDSSDGEEAEDDDGDSDANATGSDDDDIDAAAQPAPVVAAQPNGSLASMLLSEAPSIVSEIAQKTAPQPAPPPSRSGTTIRPGEAAAAATAAERDAAAAAAAAAATQRPKRDKKVSKAEKKRLRNEKRKADNPDAESTTAAVAKAKQWTSKLSDSFQSSIKHLSGSIPKIGTVTSFSFFGNGGDDDNANVASDGEDAARDSSDEGKSASAGSGGFAFFGQTGLVKDLEPAPVQATNVTVRNELHSLPVSSGSIPR